ncbi:hypothetical protein OR16_33593 [Cupriavidus basilensis OR16]|uniref:Acylphosphatase-like domain-containing protein n=1 Tax=Cupriavidus basilensis OR16 TaxID=1127483 RepID=H1SEI7_9BURK|nr:hypothetical protein OR16_33593 [Cupriavidus basilensis OR16]
METWHIVVKGRVQGVGYRVACAGQAGRSVSTAGCATGTMAPSR